MSLSLESGVHAGGPQCAVRAKLWWWAVGWQVHASCLGLPLCQIPPLILLSQSWGSHASRDHPHWSIYPFSRLFLPSVPSPAVAPVGLAC